jgi:hypothetical protein
LNKVQLDANTLRLRASIPVAANKSMIEVEGSGVTVTVAGLIGSGNPEEGTALGSTLIPDHES